MSDYNLYIATVAYREEPEYPDALPVLAKEKPTPEQVAEIWGMKYDLETDTEKHIEVGDAEEVKIIK